MCERGWGGWGCYRPLSTEEQHKHPSDALVAVLAPTSHACGSTQLAMMRQFAPRTSVMYVGVHWPRSLTCDAVDTVMLCVRVGVCVCSYVAPDDAPPMTETERITVVPVPAGTRLGVRLNEALRRVDAAAQPYVAILGEGATFARFTDVPAMVDTMKYSDLDVAGMVVEVAAGERVYDACYQLHMANYSTRYVWGFKQSMRGCMVCDRVGPAFLARTAGLLPGGSVGPFDAALDGEAVLEDLWIRGKRDARLVFGHCKQLQVRLLDECARPKPSPSALATMCVVCVTRTVGNAVGSC